MSVASKKESPRKKDLEGGKKAGSSKESLVVQTLRGMRDILPDEQPYWERVRRLLSSACQEFAFHRIDTPIAEYAHLFTRSIGTEIGRAHV